MLYIVLKSIQKFDSHVKFFLIVLSFQAVSASYIILNYIILKKQMCHRQTIYLATLFRPSGRPLIRKSSSPRIEP